jgi:phage terminase large subunit
VPTIQLPEAFGEIFEPYRYKAFYGGRGSGKSVAASLALVLMAAQRPIKVLCCREIQKSIKDSVKAEIDARIRECGLGHFFESLETEIRGANGSLFIFAGLRTNPDSIKSMSGLDIAWVEEAQRVSQRSLDLLIPTLRKPGSEVWFTWNPDQPTDPVDAMFRGGEVPPGALVRQVNWNDNRFFPEVLRAEMEWMRRRDPDKAAHVYGGGYNLNGEARVFKNWTVEEFELSLIHI